MVQPVQKHCDLPPAKMEKLMVIFESQHCPGVLISHAFCTGVHCTKRNRATRPMVMLRVAMMNQIT